MGQDYGRSNTTSNAIIGFIGVIMLLLILLISIVWHMFPVLLGAIYLAFLIACFALFACLLLGRMKGEARYHHERLQQGEVVFPRQPSAQMVAPQQAFMTRRMHSEPKSGYLGYQERAYTDYPVE